MTNRVLSISVLSLVALCATACGLQTADDSDPDVVVNNNGCCDDSCANQGTGGTTSNPQPTAGAASTTSDAGSDIDAACAVKYPNLQAPLVSPARWQLSVSSQYLPAGTNAVSIVGSVPGASWTSGLAAYSDGNGRWVTTVPNVSGFNPGTFQVQYVTSTALVNGSIPAASFADFGKDQDRVHCMSATAKSFLWCNVAGDGHTLNGCELRVRIESDGTVSPAGNLPLNY
jgi:hypothetical protein